MSEVDKSIDTPVKQKQKSKNIAYKIKMFILIFIGFIAALVAIFAFVEVRISENRNGKWLGQDDQGYYVSADVDFQSIPPLIGQINCHRLVEYGTPEWKGTSGGMNAKYDSLFNKYFGHEHKFSFDEFMIGEGKGAFVGDDYLRIESDDIGIHAKVYRLQYATKEDVLGRWDWEGKATWSFNEDNTYTFTSPTIEYTGQYLIDTEHYVDPLVKLSSEDFQKGPYYSISGSCRIMTTSTGLLFMEPSSFEMHTSNSQVSNDFQVHGECSDGYVLTRTE